MCLTCSTNRAWPVTAGRISPVLALVPRQYDTRDGRRSVPNGFGKREKVVSPLNRFWDRSWRLPFHIGSDRRHRYLGPRRVVSGCSRKSGPKQKPRPGSGTNCGLMICPEFGGILYERMTHVDSN